MPVDEDTADNTDSEISGLVGGGDFWLDTLNLLKNNPPVHALLNDDAKVQAGLDGNVLTICVRDAFTAGLIEKKEFIGPLKDAVKKVSGSEIVVRVETGTGNFRASGTTK
jgi:hypothetical protein